MTKFMFDRITDLIEAAVIGLFVACIAVMAMIVPARAADSAGLVDSIPDLTVVAAAILFGLGYVLGSRGKTRVHVVEPYADPADWGRS